MYLEGGYQNGHRGQGKAVELHQVKKYFLPHAGGQEGVV